MKDEKGTEREYVGLCTSSGAGLDRWKSDQDQLGSYLGFGGEKEKYDQVYTWRSLFQQHGQCQVSFCR